MRTGFAWSRFGGLVLAAAAAHALVTAALRLSGAFEALLAVPDAPVDLLIRMDEVQRWFGGVTIYNDPGSANYPPASYTLLWPLVGWLEERATRILYTGSILVSLAAIAVIAVRASGARRMAERVFVAVLVLPLGATQITVWIGQLGLHVVACLMGATALLFGTDRGTAGSSTGQPRGWTIDLAAGALLAGSFVKPTLSVPVVAMILILARRWRLAVLTGAMYAGATLLASAFQEHSVPELVLMWLGRESVMNLPLGSVNTHLWLYWLGVEGTKLPASLLWLMAGSAWGWRSRHLDPWIVVGVAALLGRLWIHHRAFDDVLLVIPVVALFRIATGWSARGSSTAILAAGLIAIIYALGHAPYSYISGASPVLWLITEAGRTVAWLSALGFLIWYSRSVDPRREESQGAIGS